MLPSTFDNLAWAIRHHVLRHLDDSDDNRTTARIVGDVGGAIADDEALLLFAGLGWQTTAVRQVRDAASDSFDLVLAVRTLDSDVEFWDTFTDMVRVCRADGTIIVVAASIDGPRATPGALYRFGPDAFAALARRAGIELVACDHDARGPSPDLVAVFRRTGATPSVPSDELPPVLPPPPEVEDHLMKLEPESIDASIDTGAGAEDYMALMARLHDELDPAFYLEIGVDTGVSLLLAACPALGIDPAPRLGKPLAGHQRLSITTSDDYFRFLARRDELPAIDFAFIDGMHLIENAFMDLLNVERHCAPWSLIVIDDVFPNHPAQASRQRVTQFWTGDVWKILAVLQRHRPDLLVLRVNTAPTGLLLILGADPTNDALWDSFDDVLVEALNDTSDPPEEVLHRHHFIEPTDPLIPRLARYLAACRRRRERPDVEWMRHLVDGAFPRNVTERR
jgi:hypothetical protein